MAVSRDTRKLVLFNLPPSSWALFAGALLGYGVNVLTSLRFTEAAAEQTLLWLSFSLAILSALAFGWLSIWLENLRANHPESLHHEIRVVGSKLMALALFGLGTLIAAIVMFALA